MPAEKVDGDADHKGQQHSGNDRSGRARIDTKQQGEPGEKLQKGEDDSDEIDGGTRQEAVAVNNLGKMGRERDLVVGGVYKR